MLNLNALIDSMSYSEIDNLMKKMREAQEAKKNLVASNYGSLFCKIIGEETICNLPEVEASALNLDCEEKYPNYKAKPAMLGENSVVRGILGFNRPFVAIKIEAKDTQTGKVIGVFVEVIFKRYGLDGDGKKGAWMEDNYVTTLFNMSDEGKYHSSFLYCVGGMTPDQLQTVKDLLNGKEVTSPIYKTYLIKKV